RRVDELNSAAPGPFVELHPRLAQRSGAAEGEPVAVVSRRGRAVAPARITTSIRADTVFMPFHWAGEGRANTLTNPALDPASRMPEFKACAVRLEAVRPGAHRLRNRGRVSPRPPRSRRPRPPCTRHRPRRRGPPPPSGWRCGR